MSLFVRGPHYVVWAYVNTYNGGWGSTAWWISVLTRLSYFQGVRFLGLAARVWGFKAWVPGCGLQGSGFSSLRLNGLRVTQTCDALDPVDHLLVAHASVCAVRPPCLESCYMHYSL